MQMKSIQQTKTINLIRHLLLFFGLIGFSFSTLDRINVNSDEIIDFEKLDSGDLYFLKSDLLFDTVSSKIEDEKNEIIHKKSLKDFNKTLTYKLIKIIYYNKISLNYEIISIKTNKILDILFNQINNVLEINYYNDDFKMTVLWMMEIYSSYESGRKNYNDFNSIMFFLTTRKNLYFFLNNLSGNEELKKITFNIIANYTILISRDIILDYYEQIIMKNLFDGSVLETIKKNDSCKKVYFEIIDFLLLNVEKFFDFEILIHRRCHKIEYLLDELFKNPLYLKNISDLDILINILKKKTDIILENNKKEVFYLSTYTIQFYTKYIASIFSENDEKICKIIQIFENNIYEFIILLKSFEINNENYDFHKFSYHEFKEYLYKSNITFENENFNNPHLINSIKDTFYDYILKIVMFELDNIDFKVTEIRKNYVISEFLSMIPKELEKYNFKNIISNKVIKLIEQFQKTSGNQDLLENNYFTAKDKNLLEFAFLYGFIDINEIKIRNLLLNFLETYSNKIFKSVNDAEDIEFFINLFFNITNLSKKLDMDEILKNIFLEKVNKSIFETEIKEHIENKDRKEFKKLFIIKFVNVIKESDFQILEKLEKSNEKIYKNFMINFIDNFKKLKIFYDNNKNLEFRKFVYNDFIKIFYFKIRKKYSEVYEDNIPIFYWNETEIRKEIIAHFHSNISLQDDFKDEEEEKTTKNNWLVARSYSWLMSCFIRR